MTSRLKEDERNERTIRNLLKLPENRRCINCNTLGPQYVCINFWTFVCTTCSGIHREFTHRVKSVSMAIFTSQEVTALQGGGNASAREIYFKEWDPQHQSFPDSSNIERVRDFIRHVYVDKRYTRDKRFVGPSDDNSSKNSNEERRSEDGKSPDIMRPVRDILGMKVSPIRVIEPPKANGPLRTQRSSLESSSRNPVAEVRTESSLIDFDDTAQLPQIQQTATSSIQPSTSFNNNWANFDSVQEVKVAHTSSNTNLLDALSELLVSVPVPPQSSSIGTASPILAPTVAPVQSFIQTDVKSAAKKELPADLFTLNYSSFGGPGSGPGWFPAPPQYGMGFNLQYNVPVHMPPPAYLQPSRTSYPFDAHGSSLVQFSSMASLQGALPPSGIQRTSSLGTALPAWMPTQSSVSPQLPLHGQFMGQTTPNMPPHPRQQVGGFGSNNTSFRSFNHNQQQNRGNPFG